MDTLYRRCAGIAVHKNNVVVCVRCCDRLGKVSEEIRTFTTMTAELLNLSDWLAEQGVTQVAMESTGVYWKPVFNILEGRTEVILVNAGETDPAKLAELEALGHKVTLEPRPAA